MTEDNSELKIVFFCKDKIDLPPTEEFLISRYGENLNVLPKEIIKISAAWGIALERQGLPDGFHIEKLRGYDALCIRLKFSKILIRFPFYRDITHHRLVLLLGFTKLDGYKTGSKTDHKADQKLVEAQGYYELYRLDNQRFKASKIINEIML